MKIYYIAVSSWDGNHAYTLDYIRPFLSKQKRDEAYEKMKLSPAYKKGDIWLNIDEDEVEDAPEEAVEGTIICYNDDTYAVESCCLDNKEHHHHSGDKVRIIVCKKED